MIACDCESTGAAEMSRFHQLLAGKIGRPEKSSSRATLSATTPPITSVVVAVGVVSVEQPLITRIPATHAARTYGMGRMVRLPGSSREGHGWFRPVACLAGVTGPLSLHLIS